MMMMYIGWSDRIYQTVNGYHSRFNYPFGNSSTTIVSIQLSPMLPPPFSSSCSALPNPAVHISLSRYFLVAVYFCGPAVSTVSYYSDCAACLAMLSSLLLNLCPSS